MRNKHGFTIVELLIVIVVIAVLAAISIVAYNGVQTRAKNTKTVNAAVAWVKALKLYHADKDSWPVNYSCLGNTTTYIGNSGQCWPQSHWVVRSAFLTEMQPYMSNVPEPDTTDIGDGVTTSPRRGLMYYTDNTPAYRMYLFQLGSGACPNIGLQVYSGPSAITSGYQCIYSLV